MQLKFLFFTFFLFLIHLSNLQAEDKNYFSPQQIAQEEAVAWRDYYNNDVASLVQHLSHLVIVEFRLNQLTAWTTVIPDLMQAARIFRSLPKHTSQETYEEKVLPHLTSAYEGIREAMHGEWNPQKAAKDELDWWIYRRDEKTSSPEIVGKKIADLYRLIYGRHDQGHFARAGYLRAVAARYRDLTQKSSWHPIEDADWNIIENILELSYEEMLMGIQSQKLKTN
jgi:hypothetical protein